MSEYAHARVCACLCGKVREGEKEHITQCSGWAARLITFSGWLRVNQRRLIVPKAVECFLPPMSASGFEEG